MALVPFDDRDGQIWQNGALVPWRDARLHVLSHGLHYASGVFEGERAYAGNIFKLRMHTERLFHSNHSSLQTLYRCPSVLFGAHPCSRSWSHPEHGVQRSRGGLRLAQ